METPERMTVVTRLMMEHYGDIDERPPEPRDPYRTLIGCVLSHRTRDANTAKAAEALFRAVNSPEEVLSLEPDELRTLIRCSGFYNQKARNITAICQDLVDNHGSTVPRDRETLMSLPGVGPKTADVVLMFIAGSRIVPVDRHIFRISERLGIVPEKASYDDVRGALEEASPLDRREDIHVFLIRFGRETCKARSPRCYDCFIEDLCSYPVKNMVPGKGS